MKTLPTTLKIGGFTHTQLAREGKTALYRQSKGKIEAFEVIKIQEHGDFVLQGNLIPAAETYPPASSWGDKGFTFKSEDSARLKYASLVIF